MHILLLAIAKYLWPVIALIAFVFWLRLPRPDKVRLVVFAVITAGVAFALSRIGSALYYNPRPFVEQHITPLYPHAANNGFPSDHTLLTACIALTVMSVSKRFGTALLTLAILVGIARVLGNIHSPIDIVGSLVFAIIGFGAATLLTPRVIRYLRTWRKYI